MTSGQIAVASVDGLSVVTLVATFVGYLPAIAALFTIVWTAIRIYETDTVQRFLKKFRKQNGENH